MVWFIIAIILLLIGVGMIAVALATGGDGAGFGFVPIVVAGLLMIPACLYSQDAGEVVVLKNMAAPSPAIPPTRDSTASSRGSPP